MMTRCFPESSGRWLEEKGWKDVEHVFSFALDVQFHTFGSLSCMSSDGIGLVELLDALMPWTRPLRSIMIPLCFQGRGSIADQAGLGQDKELEFAPLLHSGANFDLPGAS